MKAVVFLAALAIFVAYAAAAAPLLRADSETRIPDSYIVVFKKISKAAAAAHIKRVRGLAATDVQPFGIGEFTGYSATLKNGTLSAVLNMPEVKYVEADQEVHAIQTQCETQLNTPSWGLDRIAEVDINLIDSQFPHDANGGTDVDAYIIDTGVLTTHVDFTGRIEWGFNSVDTNNQDCNGHGTHVAGTVAGTLYGIAKKANIIAVKVLNCGGSGTTAGVIAGVNYVANQQRGRPSVANMSLGGGYSQASNDAVNAAVAAGTVFAIAAGNSNADACNFSPASAESGICVGSTALSSDINGNSFDSRSSFSNVGSCVDVFAPGSLITSAWIGTSNQASNTISGTSMAAPHVAGIAASILSAQPTLTPADVAKIIGDSSHKGFITMNCGTNAVCNASPNALAYLSC